MAAAPVEAEGCRGQRVRPCSAYWSVPQDHSSLCLFPTDMQPYHTLTVWVRELGPLMKSRFATSALSRLDKKDASFSTSRLSPFTAIMSLHDKKQTQVICVCMFLRPTCWYTDHFIFMVRLGHDNLADVQKQYGLTHIININVTALRSNVKPGFYGGRGHCWVCLKGEKKWSKCFAQRHASGPCTKWRIGRYHRT